MKRKIVLWILAGAFAAASLTGAPEYYRNGARVPKAEVKRAESAIYLPGPSAAQVLELELREKAKRWRLMESLYRDFAGYPWTDAMFKILEHEAKGNADAYEDAANSLAKIVLDK